MSVTKAGQPLTMRYSVHPTHLFFLPQIKSVFHIYHPHDSTHRGYMVSANRVGPCDAARPDRSIPKNSKSVWALQGRTSVYDTLKQNERCRLPTRMNGKKVSNLLVRASHNRDFIYGPNVLTGARITLSMSRTGAKSSPDRVATTGNAHR